VSGSSSSKACKAPSKPQAPTDRLHPASCYLLHGVTGSGKTEIYLRALTEVVKQGRQAIVLVPEIALTPQMVHRFAARFPGRVAVLHSGLTPGQRYDEWRRVRAGLERGRGPGAPLVTISHRRRQVPLSYGCR